MPKIEMHFRRFVIWLLFAALWTWHGTSARADSSTATLSVSVTDTSGAVIPGAHSMLRNSDTNQEQQNDSGKNGLVTFSFLKPGHYTLTVSKDAFADVVVDHILLNVGDDKRLQLSLKVGSPAQTVNVDGSGLQINTTDASVSTVIDRKFVQNIPLNGRSFQDLISMTPGVMTQSPQNTAQAIGASGDFSVNGQRTESNYYMVDGVSGNTSAGRATGYAQAANGGLIGGTTALGTTQALISVDALQEFRVESSSYSAEYGHSPGGQFSLATRSGTTVMHGSTFEYLRNNFFDANDWFNDHYGKPVSPLRQNDFGGTLGGPIVIPKIISAGSGTFFFGSYEGLRLTQPQAASIQYVPDIAMRQTAAPSLKPILNAYPRPTAGGVDYGILAQFIAAYSLPSSIDSTSVRIDHTFNSRLSVFFRASDTPSSSTTRILSAISQMTTNTQSYTFGATSQIAAKVANEFRLGYSRSDAILYRHLDNFSGAVPIDLPTAMGAGASNTPYAQFTLSVTGVGTTSISSQRPRNRTRQWNAIDSLTLSIGHHQTKFGVDFRHIVSPLDPASPYITTTYRVLPSIVSGNSSSLSLQKFLAAVPVFNQTSLFVQDEWHLAPRLSFSGGIRWEINPPPTEEHGNDAYTLVGDINNPSTLTVAPRGTPLWATTWYNFAPRLGVAWTANDTQGRETVLRAGGGVFFDSNNQLATLGFDGIGFNAFRSLSGSPLPITAAQLDLSPSATPPYANAVPYAFPAHLQLPYTLSWNVSLEQALGKTQSATVSYVGANGRRLTQTQQRSLGSLNPNFSTVIFMPGGVTSNYQALQVKFQRSVAQGLHALMSYTWSHSLDFGSTASSLPLTRGNSDFDVRHNLEAGASWEMQSISGGKVLEVLTERWALDGRLIARTAFPMTLQGNLLTDPATGNLYFNNVNLVPGVPIYLYQPQYPGDRIVNAAAFRTPTAISPGNAPRNFVRGFNAVQINLAARREFQLYERLHLQFRAEAFNILNHPNFGYVDPVLSDATFGQATKMLNQSLTTVSSQYQQGGPRSMQFALKLVF